MRPTVRWAAVVAVLLLLATGCSGDDGKEARADADKAPGYPVTVTDCSGAQTVFDKPPEKIVTSNASSLELLLRLGAGDRVVGTGWPPGRGTLPSELDAQAQKVKVLSRTVIPREKLLVSGADLYVNTFAPVGEGGGMGAPSNAEFKAAGIKRFQLKSTACAPTGDAPVTDLDAVETDITRLGAVTGRSERAHQLIDGMRKKVDTVQKAVRGIARNEQPSYFLFDIDGGTKELTVACNRQVANAVITLAGARSIFSDCDDDHRQVGWEEVLSRNPDWIQLGVRNRGSVEANEKAFDDARNWLRTNEATKGLTAVKKGRLLRIGLERTTIAGVENAETVEKIAAALHPDRLAAAAPAAGDPADLG
ncbi:ABC transporter substrate-binding protein [Streptomyces sp. Z26]|uniref:ABC transporter substrate-binding protein n=1 Tax=Streptomyces sp. Z26 TaxID=2500177 RepID=UPI000EF16ED3|nr:ABC transporter substrate-binding protein [Streptomyces sp. Z26]RLL67624.1 ABC transporter substrate-binding protein [Streptomyces sp. Z26]